MKYIFMFCNLVLVGILTTLSAWGDNSTVESTNQANPANQVSNPNNSTQPPESPEDKAYRMNMVKISDAITQKISEIEAKQNELNEEIYLTVRPQLQAELIQLQLQLKDLERQREQIQAQKTSRDMAKGLNQNNN